MKKSIEIKASSAEAAVEQALLELGVSREEIEIEILSKGGLFTKAEVRVTVIETTATKMRDFINGLLERMNLSCRATVEDKGNTLYVNIEGDDSGAAIGYRGEVLDAIQYLALTFLNQEKGEFKKLVVDAENYREKRKEILTTLAYRLAEKAQRTCRKVKLEPMNPMERRIIHSALADSEIAETTSEGEEPNRYVVIIPKGVEIREDREYTGGRGRQQGGGKHDNRGGYRNNDRRFDNRDDRKFENRNGDQHERAPRAEEPEIPDGREFRGYCTEEPFRKTEEKKTGAPKFKSFGGNKKF